MPVILEPMGLDEIRQRFAQAPARYNRAVHTTLQASLLQIWQTVGKLGYPPKPAKSKYTRTGTLGRTLGTSETGGTQGQPDIYTVEQGGGWSEASFGTHLGYAPYVIGDETTEQAWMHRGRWWTLPQTVAMRAKPAIEHLFEAMAGELAAWLDARGK